MIKNYEKKINNKVNKKIKTVLDKLNLQYRISTNSNHDDYFWLDYEKPMKNGDDILYSVAIIYDSDIETISIIVPGIRKFKGNNQSIKLYEKLNILNATTLFGSVYIMENENKMHTITFSHSFPFLDNEEALLTNFNSIFEYLDFFILEAKNILSSRVKL